MHRTVYIFLTHYVHTIRLHTAPLKFLEMHKNSQLLGGEGDFGC